jgi:hypothetical protein
MEGCGLGPLKGIECQAQQLRVTGAGCRGSRLEFEPQRASSEVHSECSVRDALIYYT